MARLDGRVALVTGSASGIGKEIAKRLAEEGAAVVVADVQDQAGEAVAAELRSAGARAVFVHHDVTSADEWTAAVATAVSEFGGLSILVNNAGLADTGDINDEDIAEWNRTISIDLTGVYLGMRHAGEELLKSGNGSVINISSIFGASGGFGSTPAYHAAKGGVRTMTKSVALNWAQRGVRVNSVHPGFITTPLTADMGPDAEKEILAVTPMGRWGRPEEVAAGVAYLASDDASFVTGSELYIDGGFMAR